MIKFKSCTTRITHIITDIARSSLSFKLSGKFILLGKLSYHKIGYAHSERPLYCFEINDGMGLEVDSHLVPMRLITIYNRYIYNSIDIVANSEIKYGRHNVLTGIGDHIPRPIHTSSLTYPNSSAISNILRCRQNEYTFILCTSALVFK